MLQLSWKQRIQNTLYMQYSFFSTKAFDSFESMLLEVAIHFEEGAEKYEPNNWRKGIPLHCFVDSAVRHYLKYRRGDKDDRAFIWNLLCLIWTLENKPDMLDF